MTPEQRKMWREMYATLRQAGWTLDEAGTWLAIAMAAARRTHSQPLEGSDA